MFFSGPLIALRIVVVGTQAVVGTPSQSSDGDEADQQDLDAVDDDGDAEIVRTTRLEAAPPRNTPEREVPATGVGAFVVGDHPEEWIQSDATVSTEEFR